MHREAPISHSYPCLKLCSLFGNYTGTAICVGSKITEMVRKFRHMLISVVKCILFSLCVILDVHVMSIMLYHAEAPLKGEMAIATAPENSRALLWYVQTTQIDDGSVQITHFQVSIGTCKLLLFCIF